jgi:hypothetical protein
MTADTNSRQFAEWLDKQPEWLRDSVWAFLVYLHTQGRPQTARHVRRMAERIAA